MSIPHLYTCSIVECCFLNQIVEEIKTISSFPRGLVLFCIGRVFRVFLKGFGEDLLAYMMQQYAQNTLVYVWFFQFFKYLGRQKFAIFY